MDALALAARLTLDSSDYERGLDQAGEKASMFSQILQANLVTKGIEVAVGALTKLGNAAAGVFNKAIDGYANYEQLVGGVETLFKGSADTVLANAEQAFKTAGMSANEYMATVTSFSSALIQSTGRGAQTDLDELKNNLDAQYNETKRHWQERIRLTKDSGEKASLRYQMEDELKALKDHNKAALAEAESMNQRSVSTEESLARAAKLADQAIIDMSDNVSKMGTDMQSIQNAYSGFAKQNYTINLMSAA